MGVGQVGVGQTPVERLGAGQAGAGHAARDPANQAALDQADCGALMRGGSRTFFAASLLLRPHVKVCDRRITVDEIQKAACEHYALKQVDLLSQRRTRAIARPRQVAMYLAKTMTTRSYPDIGRRFGGRDHTTVLHAVRQIERLKAEDPAIAADVEAIAAKLRG